MSHMLKAISFLLFGFLFFCSSWAVDDAQPFADLSLQSRYETLTHQLRCLVCQNETIADSGASLASDLRRELREQLAAGKSDDEVVKFMTDRYGAFVLYKPPFEPRTWLLWLGPVLLLLLGVVVAVRVIRKRSLMVIDILDDSDEDRKQSDQA